MKRGAPALGLYDDLSGTRKSKFCTVAIFQNGELGYPVDNGQNVDVGQVAGIHVVHAIDRIGGVFDRVTIDYQSRATQKSASAQPVGAVSSGYPGNCDSQCLKIAPI